MAQKILVSVLGLSSGCIVFLLILILTHFGFPAPLFLLFAPGLIFGIFMSYLLPSWDDKLMMAIVSTGAYFTGAIVAAFFQKSDFFREFLVLGGVCGGIFLGLGLESLGLIKTKNVYMLGFLSASILFLIPVEYVDWVGNFPAPILFPIWQSVIAFYVALVFKSKNQY